MLFFVLSSIESILLAGGPIWPAVWAYLAGSLLTYLAGSLWAFLSRSLWAYLFGSLGIFGRQSGPI